MKNVLILTQDPLVDLRQTINGEGISDDGKYRFYINDTDIVPDFVVVKGKGFDKERVLSVPKERTMLVTCEPYGIIGYPRGYCEQFGIVLSCQPELKVSVSSGTKVIYTPAVLPWFVGGIFDKGGCRITMNREDLFAVEPRKDKMISVVTSRKAFTKGHVDRLRFIKKLQEHYGDKVDIFGAGFKSFEDKWDAIASYKYHIVIENSECDYYWTEKLADCYLAGAYPLYHGCANIGDYFPKESYTKIDICDFESIVAIIDSLEKRRLYEMCKPFLDEAKQRVLGEYNMFNIIAKALDSTASTIEKGTSRIRPVSSFFSLHNVYLHTLEWSYYKMLGKCFV